VARTPKGNAAPAGRKPICLALQGGGAHSAFEWGVIDRLLEDDRLEIKAITGASGGAMNAVVTAAGLMDGDAATVRTRLELFWRGVSQASPFANLAEGDAGVAGGADGDRHGLALSVQSTEPEPAARGPV
jgi:NTE family protein